MVKLNLGCGLHYHPERINCDLYEEKVDVRLDVVKLPFKTGCADEILASQLLEHLSIEEVDKALVEWNRVLKMGGVLYIGVPDIERTLALSEGLKWMGPRRWRSIAMFIYGSQTREGHFHKSCFTPEYLTEILADNGFRVEAVSYDTPPRPSPWFGVRAVKYA
uniref:Putative methyltransferase n=1 Tax=viral metagenome TaxID=1070528 RepID=A0A6M3IJW6_9ZZZZ